MGVGVLARVTGPIRPGIAVHAGLDLAGFLTLRAAGAPRPLAETGLDVAAVVRVVVLLAAIPCPEVALRRLARASDRLDRAPGLA